MRPSAATAGPAPGAAPLRVTIETISYISDMVDRPGQTHAEFQEQAAAGDTIRTVLRRFSSQYAKLNEALWDPNDRTAIGSHVEVIVNDAILDIRHTLDSLVHDGDRITLTGQYIGG